MIVRDSADALQVVRLRSNSLAMALILDPRRRGAFTSTLVTPRHRRHVPRPEGEGALITHPRVSRVSL